MKSKLMLGMAAAIVTNLTVAAIAGEDKEVKITFDQVPPAVQTAVKAYATEAEITGIEDSDADGTKVIEFDIKKADKSFEVAFLKDGKLFSTEEDDLPIIASRLQLIEALASNPNFVAGLDQVNKDAFAEAHKDLVNLLAGKPAD